MSEASKTNAGAWITDPDRFATVRDQWNALAGASLFLTWDWLDCWWRAFGGKAEMRVRASFDGSQLVAGIAMGRRRRQLSAMANEKTDLFRPVARSGGDLDSVLRSIASGPWSRITFRALPEDDPSTDRLRARLRSEGWLVTESPHEACPVVDTREPYEAYSERLSRNARKQIGRAHRRLEREGRVEVKVLESVGELEPVLSECLQLEAAGRKGRSGKAILTSERKTRFWRDVFARFHGLGTLRFSSLRLDGSLIAMSLDVLHERRLYLLKTGYEERLARFSPGHVLYAEMIRASCEGTIIDAHELLGPMQPFKARYATESRQTVTWRAYRRRPVPIARYAARRWAVPLLRPIYVEARGLRDRRLERRTADRTPPPRSIGN